MFFSGCNPQVLTEYILLHSVSGCVSRACGHVCDFSGGCFVLLLANTEESVIRSARCEIALSCASPVREWGSEVTQILCNILSLSYSFILHSLSLFFFWRSVSGFHLAAFAISPTATTTSSFPSPLSSTSVSSKGQREGC